MANNLESAKKAPVVGEVIRAGEKLLIPENMSITDAIDLLNRRMKYEMETVKVTQTINVFPQDGAVALFHVLREIYGWAEMTTIPGGFFKPDQKPEMITVETGWKETMQVPWGRFVLPNIRGWIQTGMAREGQRIVFAMSAEVLRMDEATTQNLFSQVRQRALNFSIYKGKAVRIRFLQDNGKLVEMPQPKFLDTTRTPETLIYSKRVTQALNTNLFTPITRVEQCMAAGIPIKRGVLLGGMFGTGKTLAAAVAAHLAAKHGITYLYIPRADELSHAIAFAQQYQSPACVIFCEDIDRVTAGERSVAMDDILNMIDGVDSKTSNIITVLTTNEMESINPAMLRPGRLDAVIEITPPDPWAIEKIIRAYGGQFVKAEETLDRVAKVLDGTIPAIIAEVVKRAKLSQLSLIGPDEELTTITEDALLDSALTMQGQIELLERRSAVRLPTSAERLHTALATTIAEAVGTEFKPAKIAQGILAEINE